MSEHRDWLHAVAAVHAAGANVWTEGHVTVRRVSGGSNNALYRVDDGERSYACKLCVADGRRRAAREYGALRLLHAAGLDIAPQPVGLDESCAVVPFPAVIYRWLTGEPTGQPLTAQQLAALVATYQCAHALRQRDHPRFHMPEAWFHWFDLAPYLAELHDFLDEYGPWLETTRPDGWELRDRLGHLVEECAEVFASTGVDPGRGRFPLCLCRVDANLANAIWDRDGRLRWVDWEYSGWGDPALDLAELRWHAALAGLDDAQHTWLRDTYRRPDDDPGFDERIAVWDRLLATHWPFLALRWLWSEHNGPDRVRLTRMSVDPAKMRARLVHFIERAERLGSK